jgi:hypothetical protein
VGSDVNKQVCYFSHTAGVYITVDDMNSKNQKGRNQERGEKQKEKFDKIKGNNTG